MRVNNKLIMCKSLVAKKTIKKNEKLTYKNMCFKRPGNGIPSYKFKNYLGKRVKKQINRDNLILYRDLV